MNIAILAISEWLPTTWTGFAGAVAAAGFIIGSVIAIFATRAERKRTGEAHAETNKVYEQTIHAQDKFIETLKSTHQQSLDTVTAERDSYRKKSNDTAAELTACALKIKEYELRPDLTTLYHAQQTWHQQREQFYSKMFDSQEEMLKSQREMFKLFKALSEMLVEKLNLQTA